LVRRLPTGIPATTRVSLTSPLIAGVATGGACAVGTFTSILLRCVAKTQTQPDPLAFHVDIEDLHAHHLTGPHDLMRIVHKAIGHYETPYTKSGKIPYYFDANERYDEKDSLLRRFCGLQGRCGRDSKGSDL